MTPVCRAVLCKVTSLLTAETATSRLKIVIFGWSELSQMSCRCGGCYHTQVHRSRSQWGLVMVQSWQSINMVIGIHQWVDVLIVEGNCII